MIWCQVIRDVPREMEGQSSVPDIGFITERFLERTIERFSLGNIYRLNSNAYYQIFMGARDFSTYRIIIYGTITDFYVG